jgi:hypothetical protein
MQKEQGKNGLTFSFIIYRVYCFDDIVICDFHRTKSCVFLCGERKFLIERKKEGPM